MKIKSLNESADKDGAVVFDVLGGETAHYVVGRTDDYNIEIDVTFTRDYLGYRVEVETNDLGFSDPDHWLIWSGSKSDCFNIYKKARKIASTTTSIKDAFKSKKGFKSLGFRPSKEYFGH